MDSAVLTRGQAEAGQRDPRAPYHVQGGFIQVLELDVSWVLESSEGSRRGDAESAHPGP